MSDLATIGYDTRAFAQVIGSYAIPVWYFGDIPHGQSVTRTMAFRGYGCIDAGSPLGKVIRRSYYYGTDTFIARSTSLGISEYPESYELELGDAFPNPPSSSSNVSVFYNPVPEPGLASPAVLLALSTGAIRFRQRFRQ